VGLSDKRDEYPARLSGGQKQRVAIARALTMEPKVLLFDEPTSALDPTLVGEVLNVMEELAHEGATMIVVTHEMAFAREAADRVYLIEEGVFLEVGPPDQVIDNPRDPRTRDFLARTLGTAHVHDGGAVHVPEPGVHIHADEGPAHPQFPFPEHDHL
jgi:ABC-type polar amino acid transport system ATPase subunit